MARKAHNKSRRGCVTCKRRHIKCDEQHPICTNCRISQRDCLYQEQQRRHLRSQPCTSSASASPATSGSAAGLASTPQDSMPETTASSPAARTVPLDHRYDGSRNQSDPLGVPLPESDHVSPHAPAINMRHMQYLSHFILVTYNSAGLGLPSTGERRAIHSTVAAALRSPHLLHAMLALAAIHLRHRTDAAALHARALELFNATPQSLDAAPDSAAPTFLFASFIGIYMLADVSLSWREDEAALLDRFIEYVDVHRGARAVISVAWSSIAQSDLIPSIAPFVEDILRFEQAPNAGDGECAQLHALVRDLEAAGTSADTLDAYKGAVKYLQWGFDLEARLRRSQHAPSTGAIFTWPIMLSVNFIKLLQQRRPESLVILAHYGALLHRHRELWMVGDIGARVVCAITALLGRYWQPWLERPNAIVIGG
ncbi:hypothetical protein B0J12DRAFT_153624 [Macrophomina phaseolina]|uniref:Zn(2)-C6 fungal-type domain-containing protein n=1 Tax=Macrophomina phaseolina TaxID=35725 RepID=A0ABQ8G595_9PEZI|nr:hypothetical protein B0J12DRAFT_153624 [Macrophomina phaseolina]